MNKRLANTITKLEELGIKHKVIELPQAAVRSADLIDIDRNTVVKTIMFKSKKHGVFSIALRSTDRIDYKKVKAFLDDKKVSTLHPDKMRELGWEPGECCPLTVPSPLYVDKSVKAIGWIHSGSGDMHYGLEYAYEDIGKYRDEALMYIDVRQEQNLDL